MGYSIASAFAALGFPTTLISGPTALARPDGLNFISVRSAQDMQNAVHEHINDADIFISVAAVADYRPEINADQKIKKSNHEIQLKLVPNPDILKSVTELKNPPFSVGFAAETNNVVQYAKQKLKNKNLDMIIANEVGDGKAFGQDENQLIIINKEPANKYWPGFKIEFS